MIIYKQKSIDGKSRCDEVDVTVEEWKEILKKVSDFTFKTLVMFCRMPEHKGSCKEVAKKFKVSPMQLISPIKTVGEIAYKHINRFTVQETDGSVCMWIVPMQEGYDSTKGFVWQLRDELVEAIQEELLHCLIDYYKELHKKAPFNGYAEAYKWQLIAECKGTSSLDIVQKFFKQPYVTLMYNLQVSTLTQIYKENPKALGETIDRLFFDDLDLKDRLYRFCVDMSDLTPEGKSQPGDERTASALLSYHDIQKYSFFMSDTTYRPFMDYLGIKRTNVKYENYPQFLETLYKLRDKVSEDDELKKMIADATPGCEQSDLLTAQTILWCVKDEWNKIIEIDNMGELENFKHMLEYFVSHLEYCYTGNTNVRGYDEYIKSFVDNGTFKRSGFGYNGQNIQKQVSEWEKFTCGILCINVDSRNYQSRRCYLNWKGTGINIMAGWDNNSVNQISFEIYDWEDSESWETINTYNIEDLGLFTKGKITDSLKSLFNDYKARKEELDKKPKLEKMKYYINLLKSNKNLVLTGAPGTGKTYLAKEIAKAMGAKYEFVQFHPSYDYTDFVEGLRPVKKDEQMGFKRKDGIFKEFCKKAKYNLSDADSFEFYWKSLREYCISKMPDPIPITISGIISIYIGWDKDQDILRVINQRYFEGKYINGESFTFDFDELNKIYKGSYKITDFCGNYYYVDHGKVILSFMEEEFKLPKFSPRSEKPYIFIIDEINRGELSKIFGELFYAIDPGYRGDKGKVKTQYQNLVETDDEFATGFYVPENVYILATMNDIDRSVESMDFAMRRRFAWKEIKPEDRLEMLSEKLDSDTCDKAIRVMKALNAEISKTRGLGSAYQIGPAYFLKLDDEHYDGDFSVLWDMHIEILLKEYLRGYSNADIKLGEFKKIYFSTLNGVTSADSND